MHRKVCLIERLQRGEFGIPELIDALGCQEILESVVPKVADGHIDELPRRLGQQHLRPVSGRRDTCPSVNVETDISLFRKDRLARVDPHANSGAARREAVLCGPCRFYGVGGSGEGEEERVTLRVDLDAPVRRGRLAKDPAVLSEHPDVGVAQFVKLAGRALDVREDERDRSRWEIGSHGRDNARWLRAAPEWQERARDVAWPDELGEGAVINPRLREQGGLASCRVFPPTVNPSGSAGLVGQLKVAQTRCQFRDILDCQGQGEYASEENMDGG